MKTIIARFWYNYIIFPNGSTGGLWRLVLLIFRSKDSTWLRKDKNKKFQTYTTLGVTSGSTGDLISPISTPSVVSFKLPQ